MPKLSTVAIGPQLGNRFATKAPVKANNDVMDQLSLNATISRVNRVRSQYSAVIEEGKRVAGTINEKGEVLASSGSERAQELRDIIDKGITSVQKNSSQDVAGKTALIAARSQADMFESGKGTNVNVET